MGGSSIGRRDKGRRGQWAASRDEERVIDGETCGAVGSMQRSARSCEGTVVKVAKAEGDSTAFRDRSSAESSSKSAAEWVRQHRTSHPAEVSKELHEVGIALEGDLPATRIRAVDHGRHHLFRGHGAFQDRLTCEGDEAGLVMCGDTTGST